MDSLFTLLNGFVNGMANSMRELKEIQEAQAAAQIVAHQAAAAQATAAQADAAERAAAQAAAVQTAAEQAAAAAVAAVVAAVAAPEVPPAAPAAPAAAPEVAPAAALEAAPPVQVPVARGAVEAQLPAGFGNLQNVMNVVNDNSDIRAQKIRLLSQFMFFDSVNKL